MMKKLLFLLVTVMCTSFTMNAQTNLLLNGGFELGTGNTFTNWSAYNGAANMTAEAVSIHGGTRGLKAVPTGIAGQQYAVQLHCDNITTVIGKSYEVSMWVKGDVAGNIVRFSTSGVSPTVYGTDFVVSTAWQKCIVTFVASSTATAINLDLGGNGTTVNPVYVDDVAMIDLSTVSQEFLLNGGLELGSGDSTTNWSRNSGTNIFATTDAHGGIRALTGTATGVAGQQYAVQLVTAATLTLEVGRSYTATIWAKATIAGNTIRFESQSVAPSTTGLNTYGSDTPIGTGWQQITYTFVARATNTKLFVDFGGNTTVVTTFTIDDISLIGPSPAPALGTQNFNISNAISFYPNPVSDNLNISSDSNVTSITISDISGRIVKTVKNAGNIQSVNLSDLNKGVYILSTDTNNHFKFLKK